MDVNNISSQLKLNKIMSTNVYKPISQLIESTIGIQDEDMFLISQKDSTEKLVSRRCNGRNLKDFVQPRIESTINTAMSALLPRVGGEDYCMSGTIYTDADIAIQQKHTDECKSLVLQKTCEHDGIDKTTRLELKRDSFDLVAQKGTVKSILVGDNDGTLKWNDENIVRSVNGISADISGNVALTRDLTIKLTGDCSGESTFSGTDSTCEISVTLTKEISSGNDV